MSGAADTLWQSSCTTQDAPGSRATRCWRISTAVFLSLWGAMASMRLLGLLYRAHKEELGWF